MYDIKLGLSAPSVLSFQPLFFISDTSDNIVTRQSQVNHLDVSLQGSGIYALGLFTAFSNVIFHITGELPYSV